MQQFLAIGAFTMAINKAHGQTFNQEVHTWKHKNLHTGTCMCFCQEGYDQKRKIYSHKIVIRMLIMLPIRLLFFLDTQHAVLL
jgi:hypothetical protein